MDEYIVAGLGEILWDVLEDSEELGGAPVNFAYHANAMGAKGYAISAIGDDQRAAATLQQLENRNMSTRYIQTLADTITGYVLAEVDGEGVASYTFPDNVAWDRLQLNEEILKLAKNIDAVCFGSLAQRSSRSRESIQQFLKEVGKNTLKVFDLNIRQDFYTPEIISESLKLSDILKLNDDEIKLIAEIEDVTGSHIDVLQSLVQKYGLQLAALTRGGEGSLLVSPVEVSEHPGYSSTVVDTIGAGDSFTAATIFGMLKGQKLSDINEKANLVASYVCSQKGAMPPLPEQFCL